MSTKNIWKCSIKDLKLPFIVILDASISCIPINTHFDLLNRLERENLKYENNIIFSDDKFSIYIPNSTTIFKSTNL